MPLLPYNPYRKQLLTMAFSTWFMWLAMVHIVEPDFVRNVLWPNSYLPFYLITFFGLLWSFWGVTGRWKRSLMWSAIVITTLFLQMNQLTSVINMILLVSFGVVWEYYWHLTKSPKDDLFN